MLVEPIATWIMYMIHQAKQKVRDRRGLTEGQLHPAPGKSGDRYALEKAFRSKLAKLAFAEKIFKREYGRLRGVFGGSAHALTDQYELQRVGHPFYNSRAGGGEGHLEVAKNIYYMNHDLAHMVLSVKPFGCMPSTQSDGAQSAVVSKYKDMIYLPIETSGEGEINAHSRVQMALGEAKFKAKDEFAAGARHGRLQPAGDPEATSKHIRSSKRPLYPLPHAQGLDRHGRQLRPARGGADAEGRDRTDLAAPPRPSRRPRSWSGPVMITAPIEFVPGEARKAGNAPRSKPAPAAADQRHPLHDRARRRIDHRQGGRDRRRQPTRSSGRTTSGTTPSSRRRCSSS